MATLTLDLPDGPWGQATYRLTANCPRCGAPLVLRQNRQTDGLFTGCSAYPNCTFAEAHDPRVQHMSTGLVQALQTLATELHTMAQQERATERATLERTVRQLIALAHPDRWPDTPLAHEITVALVALREILKSETPETAPKGRRRAKH